MNESAYMQALWKRTGKIGNAGQGYLDTGWLDSAFGGADARKQLALQRIGDARDASTARLDLAEKGLDYQAERRAKGLEWSGTKDAYRIDAAKDYLDASSKDALIGDIITGATLPISYLEGQNRSKAIDEDRARQDRLNKRYESLLGGYK